MGKNLIVVGADFSENGIFSSIALEPTWNSNSAWDASTTSVTFGNNKSSLNFKSTDKTSLPSEATKLTYTSCIYTTGAGNPSGFGLVFWDSNDSPITGYPFPMGTTEVETKTVSIPSTAVKVSFTYLKDTLTEIPFSAVVSFDED